MTPEVTAATIAAITSICLFFLQYISTLLYDNYSLSRRLETEYTFQQTKTIKEEIAKTKTPLLQASEELNHRLWNLIKTIDEKWLEKPQEQWTEKDSHYIQSFVYRWLKVIYRVIQTETAVNNLDITLADKRDLLYLKYVKAIKHSLCDRELLKSLDYKITDTYNHFYVDELENFADFLNEDDAPIPFHDFKEKITTSYTAVEKVFSFFSKVEDNEKNKSLNLLRSLHLILISFLNTFGIEYQKTSKKKSNKLFNKHDYRELFIGKEAIKFMAKHKIENEINTFIRRLNKRPSLWNRLKSWWKG